MDVPTEAALRASVRFMRENPLGPQLSTFYPPDDDWTDAQLGAYLWEAEVANPECLVLGCLTPHRMGLPISASVHQ